MAEQRRGDRLSEHILWSAKDVFLEVGYERASMDVVAARAGTSKRSLYAHFESKERLLLAVLDFVRELYLDQLRTPDSYADEPAEAVARFCGRFQQLLVWEPQVRTCRLTLTVAERLPESARAYFDAIYGNAYARLSDYLVAEFGLVAHDATPIARELLDRSVLPRVFRTLLGVDALVTERPDEAQLASDVDLAAIRRIVAATLPASV